MFKSLLEFRLRNTFQSFFQVISLLMIYTYIYLKIYRNSINFQSVEQGGLWNIIIIALTIFGVISFVFKKSVYLNQLLCLIFFTISIWINGLVTIDNISISYIYNLFVAPSFAIIAILTYNLFNKETQDISNIYFIWPWIPISLLLIYTYIAYFNLYTYSQSSDYIALNNSYYILCAIPIFLRLKNKVSILLLASSFFVVFISSKRAGILAFAIAVLVYFFTDSMIQNKTKSCLKKIIKYFFTFLLLCIASVYIDYLFNLKIIDRLYLITTDGGSGRSEIYRLVLSDYINSNLYNIIFGHGALSILRLGYSSAHNDFINIIYEYGIMSFFILVAFYFSMFRLAFKMLRAKYQFAPCFFFSLIISLFLSMFSANLDNQSFSIVLALYWGVELKQWYFFKNKLLAMNSQASNS